MCKLDRLSLYIYIASDDGINHQNYEVPNERMSTINNFLFKKRFVFQAWSKNGFESAMNEIF